VKILFVHTRYLKSYGGEDAAVEAESNLLEQRGHEVEKLIFENSDAGGNIFSKAGTAMRAVYNASSAKKLREKLSEFKPEIIHLHNFFFEASPAIIIEAHRAAVPLVVTIHNYRLICTNALLLRDGHVCELCVHKTFPWYGVRYKCYHHSAMESMAVGIMSSYHKLAGTWKNKVPQYVTPSEFIKSKLVNSSLQLPSSKISVKRNFIPDPGESDVSKRTDYFLFVGRLSAEKGIGALLSCFSNLTGSRLVVAGGGPESESLTRNYGNLPNVTFMGQLGKEEVLGLMRQCRALIFPSTWYEGAPLTITEAFATGTPVIGTRLGAMQEMIQHNVNGLLFEQDSRQALEQAVATMNRLGEQKDYSLNTGARQTYLEHYHPDKCYDTIMNIYKSVIEQKNIM
jgi:glycosyltransferase involved in cell wall biosynthesis